MVSRSMIVKVIADSSTDITLPAWVEGPIDEHANAPVEWIPDIRTAAAISVFTGFTKFFSNSLHGHGNRGQAFSGACDNITLVLIRNL